MFIGKEAVNILVEAFELLSDGFKYLPGFEPSSDLTSIKKVIEEIGTRLLDNYPYHHPFYAGQMMKPPHPVAWLAYSLAMLINPNNHAIDGGRASSAMEKEAVAKIAKMVGYNTHLGHLTGGGTLANLEALWIANMLQPGKAIAASNQAHYTHERLCKLFQAPFVSIPCDDKGRMDPDVLEVLLKKNDIRTVVATIGTTATGSVDPLAEILELQSKYGFRIHADAAYGGYFKLVDNLDDETKKSFEFLHQVDSIVIDPHKHGLQPYGCGCILFKDPSVGQYYKHDSPYTYFTSNELHLGEISLECSRAGAAAVALWATQCLLPYMKNGEFSRNLAKSGEAALRLYEKLDSDHRFITAFKPELDIVVWSLNAYSDNEISRLVNRFFEECAKENLHLAKANLPVSFFHQKYPRINWNTKQITCLRSCLMKPEHLDWIDRIFDIMTKVLERIEEPHFYQN